jgi:threonyl-tRNA synthetase
LEDATVNVRRYGSKETAVEDLNIFIDAMEAEVKNYSRENK